MLQNFVMGFQIISSWNTLFLIVGGVFLGLIFGAIPGLTSTLAIALLLPLTYGMDPSAGMALLSSIFIGGVSGGLVPAILLNMPGTPASIATTYDGHPMALKGAPGRALSYGILASLFGGMFSLVALVTIAPLLAKVALGFQSFEYFATAIFGLTVVVGLSDKSVLKTLISAALGVLLATVGMDPLSSVPRFTMGLERFQSGFALVPSLLGLFVISEIFSQMTDVGKQYAFESKKIDSMRLGLKDFSGHWGNLLRSSVIGVIVGILPGIGGTVANLFAYDQAKKFSKHPEKFGTGIPDGIIAPEASNNAVTGSAFIPTLTLGIPGDSVTAVLMGGLILHGITPGPLLFREHLPLVYSLFVALFIANIVMVILNYGVMVRFFTWALRVPKKVLLPAILVMCIAGTYTLRYNLFDVWTLAIFGTMGYTLSRFGYSLTAMVLGLILGPMVELQMRSALMATGGGWAPFFTRPYCIVVWILTVLSFIMSVYFRRRANRKGAAEEAA